MAIYAVEALRKLLEATELTSRRGGRSPWTSWCGRAKQSRKRSYAFRSKRDLNRMSFAAIAHLMNEKGIVDGMGGPWLDREEGPGGLSESGYVNQLPRDARKGLMRAYGSRFSRGIFHRHLDSAAEQSVKETGRKH